jgi:subtilisin
MVLLSHRSVLFGSLALLLSVVLEATASQLQQQDTRRQRRIILRYKKGTRQACLEELAKISSHTTMHYDFSTLNALVLTISDDDIDRLSAHSIVVADIEDDVSRYIDSSASNAEQQLLRRTTNKKHKLAYGIEMVQAPQAWKMGATGHHVQICVIDTGVDSTHPDLTEVMGYKNPARPWNFDNMGHGTHIAGIVAGVAPEAQVLSVNIFDAFHVTTHASDIVAAAMACADMDADILSISLGGSLPSPLEEQILQHLYDSFDIITVAAAGNAGNEKFSYPASYEQNAGLLSVAAVDEKKQRAAFSQTNSRVDIAAPGVNVISSLPLGDPCTICQAMGAYKYGRLSGSSMAVPHVSGVLALLKSFQPQATSAQLLEALYASAQDLGELDRDNHYGRGLVQALGGIELLISAELLVRKDVEPKSNPPPQSGRCPTQGQVPIDLVLKTDWHPEETSLNLVRRSDQEIIWQQSNLLAHRRFHFETCVEESQCHVLSIYDSGGDGLCCSYGLGGYQVFYNDRAVTKGEVFGDVATVYLGGEYECNDQVV